MNTKRKNREEDETLEETLEAGKLRLTLHCAAGLLREIGLGWATGQGPSANLSPLGKAMQSALERYVRGQEPQWPKAPLDWGQLPPFTALALRTLWENVPFGRIVSYGELAQLAGNPRAARAAGRALAMNPWPLLVPCHRVLGSKGALTGFTNPCGLEMKRYLLELESPGREFA